MNYSPNPYRQELILQVTRMRAADWTLRRIGDEVGLSVGAIRTILWNIQWEKDRQHDDPFHGLPQTISNSLLRSEINTYADLLKWHTSNPRKKLINVGKKGMEILNHYITGIAA